MTKRKVFFMTSKKYSCLKNKSKFLFRSHFYEGGLVVAEMITENLDVNYWLKEIIHRYFIYLKKKCPLIATDAAPTSGQWIFSVCFVASVDQIGFELHREVTLCVSIVSSTIFCLEKNPSWREREENKTRTTFISFRVEKDHENYCYVIENQLK